MQQVMCANCGKPLSPVWRDKCHHCGAPMSVARPLEPGAPSAPVYVPQRRSKLAAALLALFLGGLGIHKFYLGKTVLGIVYLLFCWTFIPAIVGFVEALWLLTMSEDAFAERYP